MTRRLYITTSIPYVNAAPHVGFALELVQADATARFARLQGNAVRFQTGTDENAIKNVQAAALQGLAVAQLVERNSRRFGDLTAALGISCDDFLRTTDARHRLAVHALWRRLRGEDVYRKGYRGLYCTGCEDFYQEKDLADGCCPDHGTRPVAVVEENYFFRLSSYQTQIERLIADGQIAILPQSRRNEVLSFIRRGLEDISISRPAARTGGWGIAVPDDPSQTIYVWIDALVNYISGPGFGSGDQWRQWWNPETDKVHVIGKNVWKFHAIYWPALLLSAGLPLPNRIVVHGFVTADGKKIGKSLGNAVDPFACIDRFGADAVRYYLLRAIPPFGDGDFSQERLVRLYNADLANGLGNLVSRLASLCRRAEFNASQLCDEASPPAPPEGYEAAFACCEFDKAVAAIWAIVDDVNRDIEAAKPWQLIKTDERTRLRDHVARWTAQLHRVAYWLAPLLPETSGKVLAAVHQLDVLEGQPLFPRII